jgi:hypothetical protein
MDIDGRLRKAWLPIFAIPLVLAGVVAYFDNIGRRMFLQATNSGEVYQAMEALYMQLFHSFIYTVIIGMAFVVYYYRKDLRDTLSYLVFSLFTIYSGVWDILYYIFQGESVPGTLAHLRETPPGTTAYILGTICITDGTVTRELLYANAAVFLVLGLLVAGSIRYGKLSAFVVELENRLHV